MLAPLALETLQLVEVKEILQLETSLRDIRKQCGSKPKPKLFQSILVHGKIKSVWKDTIQLKRMTFLNKSQILDC